MANVETVASEVRGLKIECVYLKWLTTESDSGTFWLPHLDAKLSAYKYGNSLMQEPEIRIAIVHNDRLYRECLAQSLSHQKNMAVVHSSSSLSAENQSWLTCAPDVLLMQFGMNRSQLEVDLSQTCVHDAKRIIVGVPNTDDDILSCIEEMGASGYVLMGDSLEDLIENVHAVMSGRTLCSPRIANLAFNRMSALARQHMSVPASSANGPCLTRRESEIAKLIDEGLSNKEIAARLHIEVSTVKNHVHNILDKLQIHNRHRAVKYLRAHNAATGTQL